MVVKEKVDRGTKRRFEVDITALDGTTPQDPDECYVTFYKEGMYGYDSPSRRYACHKTGGVGTWGDDIQLSPSMTLGDWVATFEWLLLGEWNSSNFLFTVQDKRRPWINRDPNTIAPNVRVVE